MRWLFGRSHSWLRFTVVSLTLIIGLVLLNEIIQFVGNYRKYQRLANVASSILPAKVASDEAIVVLAGDKRRIPKALELLRQRGSSLLVISGAGKGISLKTILNWQGDTAGNLTDIWNKIIVENQSQSTIENAYESSRLLQKRGYRQVILVTSEYHMGRSRDIFMRVFAKQPIYPYPVLSDLSLSTWSTSGRFFNGLWLSWNEFWKCVAYRWLHRRDVQPVLG